jgi:hypothetical protein
MNIRRIFRFVLILVLLGFSISSHAQIPAVPTIPDNLSDEMEKLLGARRDQFAANRAAFIAEATAHNQRCHEVPLDTPLAQDCTGARDKLTIELSRLQMAADALAVEIGGAAGRHALEDERQIERMVAALPKIDEIEKSPGADMAHKAFEAAALHDWPVALAWWQSALLKDPTNESLKRAIDLAQWMVDYPKPAAKPANPLFKEAIHTAVQGNAVSAIELIRNVVTENQPLSSQADRLISGVIVVQALHSEDYHVFPVAAHTPTEEIEDIRPLSAELLEYAFEAQLVGEQKMAEELFKESEFYYMFDQGKTFRENGK